MTRPSLLDTVAEMRAHAAALTDAAFTETDPGRAKNCQVVAATIQRWADAIDYQTTAIAHHMEALFGVPKP
jgi:hypothetical protein